MVLVRHADCSRIQSLDIKGRTIRKVIGGGGTKKNFMQGKMSEKKFMQEKMSENKIHAQDGPHFDMKP